MYIERVAHLATPVLGVNQEFSWFQHNAIAQVGQSEQAQNGLQLFVDSIRRVHDLFHLGLCCRLHGSTGAFTRPRQRCNAMAQTFYSCLVLERACFWSASNNPLCCCLLTNKPSRVHSSHCSKTIPISTDVLMN